MSRFRGAKPAFSRAVPYCPRRGYGATDHTRVAGGGRSRSLGQEASVAIPCLVRTHEPAPPV